ncbi:L-xylulose reductase-like [Bradysia coprophila]|uniref:L-xylulose reductase-like n=1 Tax=Bradysia coprophila TaxID=38358 RepID=UPI00187DCBD5|nr:L-xylulose reductase-like [Bradysia coprophila]
MPLSQAVSFAGKKVLVTGGGRGLGRQTVKRFYEDGAIVYTVEKEQELVDDLRKNFPKITAVHLDVTDLEKTKLVVESFGPLDFLVNNAGVYFSQSFMEMTIDVLNRTVDVNLKALVVVSQAVAKGMIESKNGGAIINISSLASRIASLPGVSIYSSSKAAVSHMTRMMAIELSPHNIRVNSIAPSVIDVPSLAPDTSFGKHMAEAVHSTLAKNLFKRFISPDEVIDLIFYLMSPLSAMITGEEVSIDAGASIT